MVASLAERAEAIRNGGVDSRVDNMLKITNDGRKLALDQRMLNEMLPDDEGSKVNACINEVYRIWEESMDKRSTQLLFCDLSTPKGEGIFRFIPIYERSSPCVVFPNRKLSLSTKQIPKPRSRNFSKRYERAKSVSCSAQHRRWEPGRMCRIKSLLPTILTALGVRQIWNSGQEERSDRATKIRRYTSTAMLQKIPLTHICISLWRENRSLQVR